jgi:DNA-binding MarR family transcriptional regulator
MTTRARRSPTYTELAGWREYIETAGLLQSALAAGMQADSDLSPADYGVMLALSEATGHRLRSSRLAVSVGWERSRLSHHLARMERRELIVREHCLEDSRGAEVVLTERGTRTLRAASAPHLRLVRELFIDALSPEQLAAAADIAQTLRRALSTRSTPGA